MPRGRRPVVADAIIAHLKKAKRPLPTRTIAADLGLRTEAVVSALGYYVKQNPGGDVYRVTRGVYGPTTPSQRTQAAQAAKEPVVRAEVTNTRPMISGRPEIVLWEESGDELYFILNGRMWKAYQV